MGNRMAFEPAHTHAALDNTDMAKESGLAPPTENSTQRTHEQDFVQRPTPIIPLDIHFGLQDEDGSASLSGDILVTYLPEGATLNLGKAWPPRRWIIPEEYVTVTAINDTGIPIAWTIPQLTFSPPPDDRTTATYQLEFLITMHGPEGLYTETGQLTLDSTQWDAPGSSKLVTPSLPLTIHLEFHDPDNQESLFGSIVLTDVPAGTELNRGTPGLGATWIIGPEAVQIVASTDKNIPTSWTIPGLTITPPVDKPLPFTLGILVTTTGNGRDTHVHKGRLEIGTSPHTFQADDLFDFDNHPRNTPQDTQSELGWIQ